MISLSAAVMAHPRRADMVTDLLARLDRDVPVVWDQVNDRHETGIRALLAADARCTHHLVIQDDALPCRDLLAGAEKALAHVPAGHPVSLYVGAVRPFRRMIERTVAQAAAGNASWLRFQGPYWGPAVIVPVADLDDLAAWWSGKGASVENYDRRISRFYLRRRLDCFYSWPSLVDHRGDESLTGHGTGRRAHRALDPNRSALDVDWSGAVIKVDGAERADRRRQRAADAAAARG